IAAGVLAMVLNLPKENDQQMAQGNGVHLPDANGNSPEKKPGTVAADGNTAIATTETTDSPNHAVNPAGIVTDVKPADDKPEPWAASMKGPPRPFREVAFEEF